MLDYEEHLRKQGYVLIAGTDEAGRGPLCGPLVVASCIMNPDYRNDEINDSKKLTEKKREKLYDLPVPYDKTNSTILQKSLPNFRKEA